MPKKYIFDKTVLDPNPRGRGRTEISGMAGMADSKSLSIITEIGDTSGRGLEKATTPSQDYDQDQDYVQDQDHQFPCVDLRSQQAPT
jgi:hypothetical protein